MATDLTSAGAGAPASGDPVGNTTNLCSAPPRKKIPIVFVPGIMGSRLHFPAINKDWDPDHPYTSMLPWTWTGDETKRTGLRWTTACQVMTTFDGLSADDLKHGFAGVCQSFYVPFLHFLQAQQFNLNVDTPVYAVGYDWRQSNKDSGAYLTKHVDQIISDEGASQVILVSHSMGGMVTRSAMQAGLKPKVLGVVHIYQPVDGAVVMYRRYFTGATPELDGGDIAARALEYIIGNTGDKYATVTSGMPGAIQLLPTNAYRDTGGKAWLNYKVEGVVSAYSGDVYDLYAKPASPPGIIPPGLLPAAANDIKTNLATAKSFHQGLAHWEHPKTKTVDSTGLLTDMAVLFDPPTQPAPVTTTGSTWYGGTKTTTTTPAWPSRGAQRQARNTGDGTVPDTSGHALKPNSEVSGVEHSAACNDGKTRDYVKTWITELLT